LIEGLREAERIGVNPYVLGFIGSTDTHLGTPGGVSESQPEVVNSGSRRELLTLGDKRRPSAFRSAGGLAGVWAEENTRDAIFDALVRREVFATSGTRIRPRFFAGWDLPPDLCKETDLVAQGYSRGVPMGGTVRSPPNDHAPLRFVVSALQDPEGVPLQRIQIIKAWLGSDGGFHQAVHDVAGGPSNASVDPDTCAIRGEGAAMLCSTWEDPDFDRERAAFYYARVVENPSCRWTQWMCLSMPENDRPDGCTDPRVIPTIQERAWTSPIWFVPGDPSGV
jgi:hypothetical protein